MFAFNSREVHWRQFNPIADAYSNDVDSKDQLYEEVSSTFYDFYPDGMTEQEAISFFTEFIKRKGKYVQIN